MANIIHKYQKYVQKNNLLIKQIGGSRLDELQEKITYVTPHCLDGDMFHQHVGECVNDSIQMIFCFCDGIKESAQQKLLNLRPAEIIEMAYLTGREKYLAPYYRRDATDEQQNKIATTMETQLIKYLHFLQTRLCSHLDKHEIPYCDALPHGASDLTCDKYDKYDIVGEPLRPLESVLKRRLSTVSGIGAAMKLGKLVNKKDISVHNHGIRIIETVIFVNILSFCLLNSNDAIITNVGTIHDINFREIDNISAIICNMESKISLTGTVRHTSCFYICNGVEMFFDNEYGNVEFRWKNMLKYYVGHSDTYKLILCHTKSTDTYTFILKNNNDVIVWNPDGTTENKRYAEYDKAIKYGFVEIVTIKKDNIDDANIAVMLANDFAWADINHCTLKNVNIDLFMVNEPMRKLFINFILVSLLSKNCNDAFVRTIITHENFAMISEKDKNSFVEYMFFREDNNSSYGFDLFELLLKKGANIPTRLENGYTPLKYALRKLNTELCRFLIIHKISINDPFNYAPDTYAIHDVLNGYIHDKTNRDFYDDIFGLLLENDVKLDAKCLKLSILTQDPDFVGAIIHAGIDVDTIIDTENNYTALFYTVVNFSQNAGAEDIINRLLDHGANINHVDSAGNSVITHILKNTIDNNKIINMLMKKGSINLDARHSTTGENIETMLAELTRLQHSY